MRTTALAFILTAAALAAAMPADARSKDRQLRSPSGERIYDRPDRFGWYPRDSNQLKFGSAIWFQQMEAEGRFGSRRFSR